MLYRIVLPWTIGRSNPFTGRGEIAFALAARAAQLQGRQALRGSATALRASGFVAAPRPAHRRTISSTLLACGLVEPSLHSALPVLVAMHIRDDVVVSRHLEPVLRSISIDAVATTVGFRTKPSTVSLLVPSLAAGLVRPLSRAFPRPSLPSGIERVPSWSRSHVAKAHLPSANTRDVQSRERRRWNPAPLPIPIDPITRRGNRRSRPVPVLGGDGNLGLDPPPTRRHPCEYSHSPCECIRASPSRGGGRNWRSLGFGGGCRARPNSCFLSDRKHDGGASNAQMRGKKTEEEMKEQENRGLEEADERNLRNADGWDDARKTNAASRRCKRAEWDRTVGAVLREEENVGGCGPL
eukprot:scaffold191_cov677-Pavlova_lutheri.AAC.20